MLTGYPSGSRAVTIASRYSAILFAASDHTAQLLWVDALRRLREIPCRPEIDAAWRDIYEKAHPVIRKQPSAERTGHEEAGGLAGGHRRGESGEVGIQRDVGHDAILTGGIPLDENRAGFGEARGGGVGEQQAHFRITPDVEGLLGKGDPRRDQETTVVEQQRADRPGLRRAVAQRGELARAVLL